MALLAEEVVEEWLNRQGYFTIRGIKVGVDEIDILAIKPHSNGELDCRHFEVQASIRPISYIGSIPKQIQKAQGIAPNNAKKRDKETIQLGIEEWIEKKYTKENKVKVRNQLCKCNWSFEFVVNKVKWPEELDLIRSHSVKIHKLPDIIASLSKNSFILKKASGNDLVELIELGKSLPV